MAGSIDEIEPDTTEPGTPWWPELLMVSIVLVLGIGMCVFMFSTIDMECATVNATVLEKKLMQDGDVYYYTDNTTTPLYSPAGALWPGCIDVGSTYRFEYRNLTDTNENGSIVVYQITDAVSI